MFSVMELSPYLFQFSFSKCSECSRLFSRKSLHFYWCWSNHLFFIQDDHSKNPWISPNKLQCPTKQTIYVIDVCAVFSDANQSPDILLPFLFVQSFHRIDSMISGLVMFLQSVVMLIIAPIAGRLSDRIGSSKLMIITGISILILSNRLQPFILKYIGYGFILSFLNGINRNGIFYSPNNISDVLCLTNSLLVSQAPLTSFRTIGMSLESALLRLFYWHNYRMFATSHQL